MNIRVLILAPFQYQYGSKSFFVACGDSLFFDLKNEEQKEELKFILSPRSEYRKWIHVEEDQVQSLLGDIKEEFEGVPVNSGNEISGDSATPPPKFELQLPPQEPEENIFLNAEVQEDEILPTIEEEIELKEEKLEVKPEAVKEEPKKEVSKSKIEFRRLQLDALHWTKVKKVAESLKVEYTEKDETIEAILKVEFKL